MSVLSYDYRGYGLHPGVPTEASCYADVEGAYDLLTKEFNIPPSRIVLYGLTRMVVSTEHGRMALSNACAHQVWSLHRIRANLLSGPKAVCSSAGPEPMVESLLPLSRVLDVRPSSNLGTRTVLS